MKLPCPFCFSDIAVQPPSYACGGIKTAGAGEACRPVQDDALIDYWGRQNAPDSGPIFSVPRRKGGEPRCPECRNPSHVRVCAVCHNRLPHTYDQLSVDCFPIVGAKSSGKSTYLATLLYQLRRNPGFRMAIDWALDGAALTQYQGTYLSSLQSGQLPSVTQSSATAARYPVSLSMSRQRKKKFMSVKTERRSLVLFDTAGEDLNSLEDTDKYVRSLEVATGAIYVVDAQRIINGEDMTDGLRPAIQKAARNASRDGRSAVPAAVVITKSDLIAGEIDSDLFGIDAERDDGTVDQALLQGADAQLRSLLRDRDLRSVVEMFDHHFRTTRFFAVSATGGAVASSDGSVSKFRPVGTLNPIYWLLSQSNFI